VSNKAASTAVRDIYPFVMLQTLTSPTPLVEATSGWGQDWLKDLNITPQGTLSTQGR